MDIKLLLENIGKKEFNCDYWDVRIERTFVSTIHYKDFELQTLDESPTLGAFIRVFKDNMWITSSLTNLDKIENEIEILSKTNVKKFNDSTKTKPYSRKKHFFSQIRSEKTRVDQIEIAKKIELIQSYFDLLKEEPGLKDINIIYKDHYKQKYFLSSSETYFEYDHNFAGLRFMYTACEGKETFNDVFSLYGGTFDELYGMQDQLSKNIEESFLFTKAQKIEEGKYPVLMNSLVVGVFAHESFGHKSEADFILGNEKATKQWEIGKVVASRGLSIIDEGNIENTSGYCPIDDEGFLASKTYLIKDGILQGRLHSANTANYFHEKTTGNARAISFEYEPIVRMTNTYVEKGQTKLEDIISGIKKGIFVKGFKHGSGMSTFTIAPLKSYLIEDGKITVPILVSVISGNVFETLKNIDAVSDNYNLESMAFGGCGKGEQWPLPVSFGGPDLLVSGLHVS
jgi:TldD protein